MAHSLLQIKRTSCPRLAVTSPLMPEGSACYRLQGDISPGLCGGKMSQQRAGLSGSPRGSSRWSSVLVLVALLHATRVADAVSERGRWTVHLDGEILKEKRYFVFPKTLFSNSIIRMTVVSESCDQSSPVLNVSWYLRSSSCYDQVFHMEHGDAQRVFGATAAGEQTGSGYYIFHQYDDITCRASMSPHTFGLKEMAPPTRLRELAQAEPITAAPGRRRRSPPSSSPMAEVKENLNSSKVEKAVSSLDQVASSWEDGPYVFIVRIRDVSKEPAAAWSMTLEITMKGPHDYISASEWPLMLFYMVMCVVYVLLALSWLCVSAWFWRDLLRIQFWIGGVVFLGLVEKAVYLAEFQSLRDNGLSVQGALVFAELLSAVKRTLARVLVLIASLGYGIVKPRLGALLHRVVGVGLLYFLFSVVEGILSVNAERGDSAGSKLMCDLALAFIDSCLVWWILVSLSQTMKLLRLRRNAVKLSLYRHFTNTLLFAVIASVIFIVWTTKTFTMSKCQSDWGELWIDDAFWRFLFSMILMVIMFLWRPSANNQRYAFSPLVDEESDEEEQEAMLNENFDGMKMRGAKPESNGSKLNKDEDLRWVEENIPSSMADVALPPLLDSDEETMTTQFEMSKME
ncbi:transmembrane protein 87A isoform X2 [Gadus morhua]|uniref:transmembrane protein 87A isoform X2 n=1 Tax=Gadus morhua TaxID=8049 RepID=UPI0011B6F09D|nr:transmembrane protein 87A-like isoform X2 [Gadus morhua]